MRHRGGVWPEKLCILVAVAGAAVSVVTGVALALLLSDSHWVNRSGAAVVALQGIALLGEALRRRRLNDLRAMSVTVRLQTSSNERLKDLVDAEREAAERSALSLVIALAAVGEIVHGFGDLVYEALLKQVT